MTTVNRKTTGISFTLEDWNDLMVAEANGHGKSTIVRLGLEALRQQQPALFLPKPDMYVSEITRKSEPAAQPEPTADAA